MSGRSRLVEDNPYDNPQDPRYIPHFVWDQLDMEGRMWVATRQQINEADVAFYRARIEQQTKNMGRMLLIVIVAINLAWIIGVLAHLH